MTQANGQKNPNIVRRILKLHNDLRAQHGAPPLRWSGKLARSSQVSLIFILSSRALKTAYHISTTLASYVLRALLQ